MSNTMKSDSFRKAYLEKAASKGLNLTPEDVETQLNLFYETLQESLLDYPGVIVEPLGLFSLSRLSPRVRVLRNIPYEGKVTYRVRYYISQDFQDKLVDSYEKYNIEEDD